MISLSPSEFSNTTCLSCDAAFVNRTFDYTNRSVIERSIGFDYQSFGNRTFDCVRLAKFYCEFDYVRLSSAIERLVFDWVRLDRSGLRYRVFVFHTPRPVCAKTKNEDPHKNIKCRTESSQTQHPYWFLWPTSHFRQITAGSSFSI